MKSIIKQIFPIDIATTRNNEIEQSFNRVIIGLAIFLYIILTIDYEHTSYQSFVSSSITLLSAGYLLASICLFLSLYSRYWSSLTWRTAALLVDVGALSTGIVISPQVVLPLFAVYLWIIIGYGFRYGTSDLLRASLITTTGFLLTIVLGTYNEEEQAFTWGILVALIIIPSYAYVLLKRINEKNAEIVEQRKKAEAASEAKSSFLSNISHELRTPLNGVVAVTKLLDGTSLNPQQKEYTQTINDSAATLLELIDDLLDFSKIESGNIKIESVECDIHAIARRAVNVLTPLAQQKNLAIDMDVHLDEPYYIKSDPARLAQLMINLGNNAIKFTDRGYVKFNIYEKSAGDASKLHIEVIDTGIGIDKQVLDKIFERFYQVDGSVTRRYRGTGLGLAICKQIVDKLGGDIGVSSEPGVGSRFWFDVPAERVRVSDEASSATDKLEAVNIVSNNPVHTRVYQQLLEQWNVSFRLFDSVTECVNTLLRSRAHGQTAVLIEESTLSDENKPLLQNLKSSTSLRATLILAKNTNAGTRALSDLFDVMIDLPVDSKQLYQAIFKDRYPSTTATNVKPLTLASGREQPARRENRKTKILVAEDQSVNQFVIKRILEEQEYTYTIVEDGNSALDALENEEFDIALLDYHMPDVSGIEVVQMFRLMFPASSMPFLIITADVRRTILEEISKLVDGYITKPITPNLLINTINNCLRNTDRDALSIENKYKNYDQPFFDIANLENSYTPSLNDLEFLKQLFDAFKSDADTLLVNIESDIMTDDLDKFHEDVHALKGVALHAKASRLHRLAQDAEELKSDEKFSLKAAKIHENMTRTLKNTYSEMLQYINKRVNDNQQL